MGTSAGLMRFDGVKFVPWVAPKGMSLGGRNFTDLLGSRDGSLWIATASSLGRFKDGQLQNYMKPTDRFGIDTVFEDHAGKIWFTRYRVPEGEGPICQIVGDGFHCYGQADGIPFRYGLSLSEDDHGNFWFGSIGICRWRPGSSSTYLRDVLEQRKVGDGVTQVVTGQSGSVWAAIDGVGPGLGVVHYSGGKWKSYVVPGFDGSKVRSHALFMDRNQALWIGTENDGFYRIHDGVADHYGSSNGLSGNSVLSFFEDREGNLWVATDGGVDMFRDTAILTFSVDEGLTSPGIRGILAPLDGSTWIGTEGAVDILRAGKNSPLLAGRGLPGQDVSTLYEDHTGAMWLGLDDKLMKYEDGLFHEVKQSNGTALAAGLQVDAITEDTDHNIWALVESSLFRISKGKVQENIPLKNGLLPSTYLAADHKVGIWISARRNTLAHFQDGHFQTYTLNKDGESPLVINGLLVDSDNSLLVPTSGGLFRLNEERWSVLDSKNGLPCNLTFSAIRDNSDSLWLYALCGLIKIESSEVARWRDRPESNLAFKVFDVYDGAHPGMQTSFQPATTKATNGQLWFTNNILLQMIDPAHLYGNNIPPPVLIEEVIADKKNYQPQDGLSLPALTRDLEIDYTALSFSVPHKVRFRYKLEGHDTNWQEPVSRRQAFYTDLRPGNYQFRVIACNSDGVWNDAGASLSFRVAPAWDQTRWFYIACVVTGIIAIWSIYRLRVRQVARAISARFDERLAERTRIARELHDTLLQTIQGSKMVADDALERSTDSVGMVQAMGRVSEWLGQAVREGRTALDSLRTSTIQRNDLAEALRRATSDCVGLQTVAANFSVVGDSRDMHPIVRDEVYRIGYEAIRNACMHSQAKKLEVSLKYGQDLNLRVSDDGVGIDPIVASKGKERHFGLEGMRERAGRIGGKLTLTSNSAGTEIKLEVPGGIVFRKTDTTVPAKFRNFFMRLTKRTKLE